MTSLHKEIHLEDEICEHLAGNGWLTLRATQLGMTARGLCFPPM